MNASRDIFAITRERMAWLDRRQSALAVNVANANTPKFTPTDLPAFATVLGNSTVSRLTLTRPNHLAGSVTTPAHAHQAGTHSPDGNSITLDQQLVKIADTEAAQNLTVSVHRKYMGMFALALGRGG